MLHLLYSHLHHNRLANSQDSLLWWHRQKQHFTSLNSSPFVQRNEAKRQHIQFDSYLGVNAEDESSSGVNQHWLFLM